MNALCMVIQEDSETWIIKIYIKCNPFLLLKTTGQKKTFSNEGAAIKHAHLLGFSEANMKLGKAKSL